MEDSPTSPLQKPTAKAATSNQNVLLFSLSHRHNRTSKSRNSISLRNRTVFAITRIAARFSELVLISSLPMLATPTWIPTRTCHTHTTAQMPTTLRCSAITTLLFQIMKYSLWDKIILKFQIKKKHFAIGKKFNAIKNQLQLHTP